MKATYLNVSQSLNYKKIFKQVKIYII